MTQTTPDTIDIAFRPDVLDVLYALLTQHPLPVPYWRLEPVIQAIREGVTAHNEKAALKAAVVGEQAAT